ncbi:UDP glucuronosyltransferase 5 family, polypeptide D1 isoform X4 [Astyanax mexicanus]|uniref:UDP glucuronosyltransferase 5 family, polypeptide D1 isoform X4 n=1 Tax=Astyanax mexicanus TaxID=7994 RepID=UPI0020CB694C|nr:UDP glucuronosyltransferase 5 family, polypeptide D1 isoform X4 [Astyanax mexicanus]XP_049324902.1 UDP glucuronosyltransferase 5 family, polypeptide D1 isoform X4 [Astyanax mexicanus]XP_049324903.1 UDP glucuronosyltransferase 5 family, polypeptide D1 isoform X4 [Astyanax mexicanus]
MYPVLQNKQYSFAGLFLCVSVLILSCESSKILIYPVDGSHWVNMKVLIEALHSKGHEITVLRPSSSFYLKEDPSLFTSIIVEDGIDNIGDFFEEYLNTMIKIQRGEASVMTFLKMQVDFFSMISHAHLLACNTISMIIEDKELVKRLQDEKYDLVLTDPALTGGVLLAHYLNLPFVLNARWITSGEGHFAIAPSPLSYIPVPGTGLTDKMTFTQRVKNFLFYSIILFQQKFVVGPHYDALCSKYIDNNCDIVSLLQEADIWLMRLDFVFDFPRPTMPNVVYMGGFQCKPSKPLPQDLEAFVQSSGEHGFIIMTLGTLVDGLPADTAEEIAAVFSKLPQKVIWRHLGAKPSTLGNNTLLVDWMPQNDLLGHPKIKAFVAHGGTNGVQEAIYHGVPVLGIPLFFDQFDNLMRIQAKGAAKILELSQLNGHNFEQMILEILNDESYRMNMQRLSRTHRDQPMEPLDTAVFWIEYVIRHKGAPHLRTKSYRMPWYSYHSLDVILFLFSIAAVTVFMIVAFIRYVCCRACCKRKVKHE